MEKGDGLSADDLVREAKIVFAEFGLLKKIVLDAGTNFLSDWFKTILQAAEYRQDYNIIILPLEQWTGGSMHKILKASRQKFFDNNNDVNLTLLQIRLTPIGVEVTSSSTLFVSRNNKSPIASNE